MTNTITGRLSLRDAMYQMALAKPVPDAELLDEFVRRFPEHSTGLTEFAIALALDAFGETEDEPFQPSSPETSPAVSRAMSRFQNRLYAAKKVLAEQVNATAPYAQNPFASMQRAELRTFAERLNANLVFVMKLRDRQIEAGTMSKGFQRRVSEELRAPIEVVVAHFAAQSEVRPSTRFKAAQKPEGGAKQTFEEAVQSTGLTSEQQEYLLNL
jgi:hypothetical protein